MSRRGRIAGAAVILALVVSGAVAWPSAGSGEPKAAPVKGAGALTGDVGIAGPLGPEGLNPIASYYQRVTFSANQLGQAQEIAARLPAGKYLVEVLTPNAAVGSGPDCMGVSFPLVPPTDDGKAFTGFVSLASNGDEATVSCSERAVAGNSTATYELFYIPAAPSA